MFNFNLNNLFRNINNRYMIRNNSRSNRFVGEYKVVEWQELHEFLRQDVCILDVRDVNEFKSMHVKNAINIPLNLLAKDVQSIIPDNNTKILVYCMSGERTKIAISKLNVLGYKNIYIWGNGGLNTLKFKDLLEY